MDSKQNTDKNWFAVEITIPSEASEAVEFALNELNSLGNEINNLGKNKSEDLTVIGYFNDLPNEKILQSKLNEALEIYGYSNKVIKNIETKEVENQDWLAEWKKYWKPTETNKFIISPPWENIETNDKIIIKIEPNMAFGTGTHETTRLCLRAIEKYYSADMSFYDVGTGTGILVIAAVKFSGEISNDGNRDKKEILESILACDIDADSIKIARENAKLNDVEGIKFYIGSIDMDSPKYDFVCANVTADIIVPMLPLLMEHYKKVLVLSGILVEQKQLILDELNKFGVENPIIETDGEWISVVIRSD